MVKKKQSRIIRRVHRHILQKSFLVKVELFQMNKNSFLTGFHYFVYTEAHLFSKIGHKLAKEGRNIKKNFQSFEKKVGHFLTSPAFKKGLQIFTIVATVLLIGLLIASGVGVAFVGPLIMGLSVVLGVIQTAEGISEIVHDPKDYHGYIDTVGGMLGVLGPITESASVAVKASEAAQATLEAKTATSSTEEISEIMKASKVSKTTKFFAGLKGSVTNVSTAYTFTNHTRTAIDDFKHHEYMKGVFDIVSMGLDLYGGAKNNELFGLQNKSSGGVEFSDVAKQVMNAVQFQTDLFQLATDLKHKDTANVVIDLLDIGLDITYTFSMNSTNKDEVKRSSNFGRARSNASLLKKKIDTLDFSSSRSHTNSSFDQRGGFLSPSSSIPLFNIPGMIQSQSKTVVPTFQKLRHKEPFVAFLRQSVSTKSFISLKTDHKRQVI